MKRRLAWIWIYILFFFPSCFAPNPALFSSYDVLRPGPEVQITGSVTLDGKALDDNGQTLTEGVVVNQAFLIWVYELQQEISKLRKQIK